MEDMSKEQKDTKNATQAAAEAILEEMGDGELLKKAKTIHVIIDLDGGSMGPKPKKDDDDKEKDKDKEKPEGGEDPRPEEETDTSKVESEEDDDEKRRKEQGKYNFQK